MALSITHTDTLVKIKISVDTSVKRDDTEPVNYKET